MRIDPTKLKFKAFLVLAYAKYSSPRLDDSVHTILKYPDGLFRLSPNWKKWAAGIAQDTANVRVLKDILMFEDNRNALRFRYSDTDDNNHIWLSEFNAPDTLKNTDKLAQSEKWKKGVIAYEIAEYNRTNRNYEGAREYYEQAYDLFLQYPEEIRNKGIRRRLAECLLNENRVIEAYHFMGSAYRKNPAGFNEMAAKGDYLLFIADYDKALSELEGALYVKTIQ